MPHRIWKQSEKKLFQFRNSLDLENDQTEIRDKTIDLYNTSIRSNSIKYCHNPAVCLPLANQFEETSYWFKKGKYVNILHLLDLLSRFITAKIFKDKKTFTIIDVMQMRIGSKFGASQFRVTVLSRQWWWICQQRS